MTMGGIKCPSLAGARSRERSSEVFLTIVVIERVSGPLLPSWFQEVLNHSARSGWFQLSRSLFGGVCLWAPLEGASSNCNAGLLEFRQILANSVYLSVRRPSAAPVVSLLRLFRSGLKRKPKNKSLCSHLINLGSCLTYTLPFLHSLPAFLLF